jgi:TolA-binding protein
MKKGLLLGVVIIGLLLSSCSKNYDEYLNQATELKKAANYEEALAALDNAVKKAETAPQRVAANIKAGDLASNKLKDLELADQYYQATLADITSYSAGDLRDLAKQALTAQANKAAVSMYQLWFENFPDSPDLISMKYEFAEVYHKNIRDLKNAIVIYEEVVTNYPDSEQAPKALFSIGYIYANELGDNNSAEKYYSQFIEKYPDHEMAPSVEFELKYLGKTLEEIPELQHLLSKTS